MILHLKVTSTSFDERTPFYQIVTQTFFSENTNLEYKGRFKEKFNFNDNTLRVDVERSLLNFYVKENDNFVLLENVDDNNVVDHHCGEGCCHLTIDV